MAIGLIILQAIEEDNADCKTACRVHKTKHPGNGSVAIQDGDRVCAVGGWDGKCVKPHGWRFPVLLRRSCRIRLYSTRSMKSLGTLEYHREGCQAVTFARRHAPSDTESRTNTDETDDDMDEEEKAERGRWLAAGGQDQRVSLWTLMDFGG